MMIKVNKSACKNTGAVIVSAGLSSRMGDFKPLLEIGGKPIIGHLITTFRQALAGPIVVVTGHRAAELEEYLSDKDVICVRNNEYITSQMFDSACIGFSHIADICNRTFFTPVDIPLFSESTLRTMLSHDAPVVFPVFNGKRGHPALLSTSIIPTLMQHGKNEGLREAFSLFADETVLVDVDDIGTLYDADTPAEFSRLVELYSKMKDN